MQQAMAHADQLAADARVSDRTIRVMREQAEFVESELDKAHKQIHTLQEELIREQAQNRSLQRLVSGCSSCSRQQGEECPVTPTVPYSSTAYGALDDETNDSEPPTIDGMREELLNCMSQRVAQGADTEAEEAANNMREEILANKRKQVEEQTAANNMREEILANKRKQAEETAANNMREEILVNKRKQAEETAANNMREEILGNTEKKAEEVEMVSNLRDELLTRMAERVNSDVGNESEEGAAAGEEQLTVQAQIIQRTQERLKAMEERAERELHEHVVKVSWSEDKLAAEHERQSKPNAAEQKKKTEATEVVNILGLEIVGNVKERALACEAAEAAQVEASVNQIKMDIMKNVAARAPVVAAASDRTTEFLGDSAPVAVSPVAKELQEQLKIDIMKNVAARAPAAASDRTKEFLGDSAPVAVSPVAKELHEQQAEAEPLSVAFRDPKLERIRNAPLRLVVIGTPGSGKAQICEQLAADQGIDHISAGQLLRDQVAASTDIGERISWHLQHQKPVPDEVVIELIVSRLRSSESSKGWMLEGFPRNKIQARALSAAEFGPNTVFLLKMPKELLIAKCEHESELAELDARVEEGMESLKAVKELYWSVAHQLGAGRAPEVLYEGVKRVMSGNPFQVAVLGAPGTGKGKVVLRLTQQLGLVHITKNTLIRSLAGHELSTKAEAHVEEGGISSVPDELFAEMLMVRVQQQDCQRGGWLLDGWPNSKKSFQLVAANGLKPQLVMVNLSEKSTMDMHVNIRYGVANHKKYDMRTNPPPEGVEVRSNPSNTAQKVRERHAEYQSVVSDVLSVLPESDELVVVDGDQPLETIYSEIEAALYASMSGHTKTVKEVRAAITSVTSDLSEKSKAAEVIQARYRGHKERRVPREGRKFIIAGPPASGKGTQSRRIMKEYGVVHISTGSLLRDHVNRQTEIGLQVKPLIEAGSLVPDELMIDMVKTALESAECRKNGWLLDGFPRTAAQAEAMKAAGIQATAFIVLDTPAEVLVERAIHRRMDPETGAIYHMINKPPPEEIAARLTHRADDQEDKVRNRVQIYNANIESVVGVFNDRLVRIDGNRTPDVVFEDIRRVVEKCPWQLMFFGAADTAQVQMLADTLAVEHIDLAHLVQEASTTGFARAEFVQKVFKANQAIDDKVLVELLCHHLKNSAKCVENGWILNGLPSTVNQLQLLQKANVIADRVIQLQPVEGAIGDSDDVWWRDAKRWWPDAKRVIVVPPNDDAEALHQEIVSHIYEAVRRKDEIRKEQQWLRPVRRQPSGEPYKLFVTSAPVPQPSSASGVCQTLYREMGITQLCHESLHKEVEQLDSELFREAQACVDAEGSLSDSLTLRILQKISKEGITAEHGWTLQGFPSNVTQAAAVKDAGFEFDRFININLSIEEMEQRLKDSESAGQESLLQELSDYAVNIGQVMAMFKVHEMKVDGDGDAAGIYSLVDSQLNCKMIG